MILSIQYFYPQYFFTRCCLLLGLWRREVSTVGRTRIYWFLPPAFTSSYLYTDILPPPPQSGVPRHPPTGPTPVTYSQLISTPFWYELLILKAYCAYRYIKQPDQSFVELFSYRHGPLMVIPQIWVKCHSLEIKKTFKHDQKGWLRGIWGYAFFLWVCS